MVHRIPRVAVGVVAVVGLSFAPEARAIPAFARKYETSCLTCHTVFPKLNPFGEAFRRNGYRFPGIDSDYVKQGTVVLSQEANKKTFPNSVWPGTLPISVPLSIGANGQGFFIPSSTSTAGRNASAGTVFTVQDLVAEGHIWAGASLDDSITIWAELTFSGSADVEHAQVLFNDLVGPKHAVNLIVGRGFPNITSFGPHSSYIADQLVTNAPVGLLLGGGSGWQLVDNYTGVELNGVVEGRVDYAVGLNAGANSLSAVGINYPTEDFYGRLGVKLGGMRLDGEGSAGPQDALHPWAETAVSLYAFGYHSNTRLNTTTTPPPPTANDVATTWGLGGRAQYGSAELNAGWYQDRHNHGTDAATAATARVFYGELSYVVFPWLVPALRVENVALDPEGAPRVDAWHVMPGVACLIRPNIRLVLVANWEHANGFPSSVTPPGSPLATGWSAASSSAWGAFTIAPGPGVTDPTTSSSEFQSVALFLAWAM
jgi:hypothetical protein